MTFILLFILSAFLVAVSAQTFTPARPVFALARAAARPALVWQVAT